MHAASVEDAPYAPVEQPPEALAAPVAVMSQACGKGVICENSLYVIHVGSYDLLKVKVTSLGLVATTFLMLSGKSPGT